MKSPRNQKSMNDAMNQTSPQVAKSSDKADVTITLSPDKSGLSINNSLDITQNLSPRKSDMNTDYIKPKRSSRRTTLGTDAFKAKDVKEVPPLESTTKSKESYLQFRNQSRQKKAEFYEEILKEH